MTVVRSEFEQGENSPSNLLNERMMSAAYNWHNYGKSTIGNRTDIERVPIKNLQAFYKKYYQPDNCLLVIAGKFDPAKALELTEKYWQVAQAQCKLDRTIPKSRAPGRRAVLVTRGRRGRWRRPIIFPRAATATSRARYSGRIWRAAFRSAVQGAVEPKGDQRRRQCHNWSDPGIFEVDAEAAIRSTPRHPVGYHRNGRRQTNFRSRRRTGRQQLLKRERRVRHSHIAVEERLPQGDWRLYSCIAIASRGHAQEVQEVAKKYLRARMHAGLFIPTESRKRPNSSTPELAKLLDGYKGRGELELGEAFDVSPANIDARSQRSTLAGGIKAIVLPKKTRGETVNARVVLRYGTADSLKGYEAAADLLPSLMLREPRSHPPADSRRLDKHRATIVALRAPESETGKAVFSVQAKRGSLPAVLTLLKQILREPTLPAEEFEVLRRQQLSNLEELLTDPAALAITRVRRTVSPYPKGDVRYIPTLEEEGERYTSVSLEKIKSLYTQFLGSQAGEVAIVGDFDPAENLKFSATRSRVGRPGSPMPASKDLSRRPGGLQTILTPDKANAVYVGGLVFP
jgi:zinc protease